jgi:hypothetical protein
MFNLPKILLYSPVFLLAACGEPGGANTEVVPEHSVTFYREHPLDAEMVKQLCSKMDERNKQTLDDSAYEIWHTSEDWKRCENAMFVIDAKSISKLF